MIRFCSFILKLFRYKIDTVNIPTEAKKCVLLFAPHASMLDFLVGYMALRTMHVKTVFLIKSEVFWCPLGVVLKKMGGIPVNRKNAARFHHFAADMIKEREEVALLISPEGTRKLNPKWKKGFYYIAKEADVPVLLGYLDYRSRRGGIGGVYQLTDDVNADIEHIKQFYNGMQGRYPNCFDREHEPYAHTEWL
ncbi:MAG: 1-acyl-sn-glycerol-3-phosphate acyltransferase [Bacteroidales bacterium]|jgi:1-acyl-sn-glycerol-3-phosphate acyltransferase|nr:1-acyl-sn-glycerol-3-phosphate acyltransferase [Bacteroidales bacterium]